MVAWATRECTASLAGDDEERILFFYYRCMTIEQFIFVIFAFLVIFFSVSYLTNFWQYLVKLFFNRDSNNFRKWR